MPDDPEVRRQVTLQLVKLGALLIAVVVATIGQRMMSDPDFLTMLRARYQAAGQKVAAEVEPTREQLRSLHDALRRFERGEQ